MAMVWHDLLFAHWPIDVDVLRERVPAGLEIDTLDGQAWIGVVPFTMSGVRPRGIPALPGLSAFPEINVRTYVRMPSGSGSYPERSEESQPPGAQDKPGVYFFSLDAAHLPAVLAARGVYRLPYYWAKMEARVEGSRIHYRSTRRQVAGGVARFEGTYGPASNEGVTDPPAATDDRLARWLTERYCLYTTGRGGTPCRAEIHHPPWPLEPAEADIRVNSMTQPLGIPLPDTSPLLHFARRLDVVAWRLEQALQHEAQARKAESS